MKRPEPAARKNPLLGAGLMMAGAGVPLVFYKGIVSNFGLPKLALLSVAVFLCAAGSPKPRKTPLDSPLAAAALVLGLSTLFSADWRQSIVGTYNYFTYGLWPLALCAALYFFAAWEDPHPALLDIMLLSGALSGGYAILQKAGLDPIIAGGHLLNGRAIGASGSPVALGAYLAALCPVALHQALSDKRRPLAAWLRAALIGAGLAASIARGAWAAAGAGVLAYLWLTRRASSAAAGAILLAAVLSWPALSLISPRSHTSQSDAARREIWKAALRMSFEHPVLGWGPDTFELGFRRHRTPAYVHAAGPIEFSPHAHNDILQALATTGLTGLAAYLWTLLALARSDLRSSAAPGLAAGLAALFVDMKVNPAPIESLALASIFAGILCGPGAPRKAVGWLKPLLVCASALSVVFSARLFAADREIKLGKILAGSRPDLALRHFEAGIALSPCELTYRAAAVNQLLLEGRPRSLEAAARHALAALACHPNSPNPRFGLGGIALMQAQAGMPGKMEVARRQLDAALDLDPLYLPLLETRLHLAQALGDQKTALELSGKMAALR